MASKHKAMMGIEFEGFEEAIKRLQKLEGDVKGVTEKALKETHKIVTAKAKESVQNQNLPAHGKFHRERQPNTLGSLKTNADIEWSGTVAQVPVGFSISKGGLPSIFMMYGTPRYMKNQMMYDAIWSQQTHDQVLKAQETIFYNEISKLS
jgi:hypothetical protein